MGRQATADGKGLGDSTASETGGTREYAAIAAVAVVDRGGREPTAGGENARGISAISQIQSCLGYFV